MTSFEKLAEIIGEETPITIMVWFDLLTTIVMLMEVASIAIAINKIVSKHKLLAMLVAIPLGLSWMDENVGSMMFRLLTFFGSLALSIVDRNPSAVIPCVAVIPGVYLALFEQEEQVTNINLIDCRYANYEYYHFISDINYLLLTCACLCVVIYRYYVTNQIAVKSQTDTKTLKNTNRTRHIRATDQRVAATTISPSSSPSLSSSPSSSISSSPSSSISPSLSISSSTPSSSETDYRYIIETNNNTTDTSPITPVSSLNNTPIPLSFDTPFVIAEAHAEARCNRLLQTINPRTAMNIPRQTEYMDDPQTRLLRKTVRKLADAGTREPTSIIESADHSESITATKRRGDAKRKREDQDLMWMPYTPAKNMKVEKNKSSTGAKRRIVVDDKTQNIKKKRRLNDSGCKESITSKKHHPNDDDNNENNTMRLITC